MIQVGLLLRRTTSASRGERHFCAPRRRLAKNRHYTHHPRSPEDLIQSHALYTPSCTHRLRESPAQNISSTPTTVLPPTISSPTSTAARAATLVLPHMA